MPSRPPLRIALLTNSTEVLAWQHLMLKRVQDNGTGNVVLAIVRGEDAAETPTTSSLALSLFYRYINWDRKKFSQEPDPFKTHSVHDLNPDIETLTLRPDTTRWSDSLNDADVATLKKYDVDVIIRLGWRIIKGDLLTIPRYGVWSFHHGDNRVNRGGPPGVWEHFQGQECTGVTLQILSENLDDGIVLERSLTATDKTSITKTRVKLYWRSVDMLPRQLEALRQLGYDAYLARVRKNTDPINFYSYPLFTEKRMTVSQVLKYFVRFTKNYVTRAIQSKYIEEKWVLYFRLSQELSTSLWQYEKIESGNDRYWADPHVIKRDGTYYVFVEEFIYKTDRGRIAVIPISEDGTVGESQTVLETDYHLSYPFVFEHDGETYMIPESSENRSVDLYRCTEFPNQWDHVKTLLDDVQAVDTTLHHDGERWWLFANRCDTEGGTTHDELSLYSAHNLLDDVWTPHPMGVVVSDVRMARPAGALFYHNDRLYRPAQDCCVEYGYALQINEVTQLTETDYAERPVSTITPDWNERVKGVHTISNVPGLCIFDAKTHILKSRTKLS